MVQVPAETPTMVLPLVPDTVHTLVVRLVKVTASPELAVALAKVEPPTAKMDGVKVIEPMVWLALVTMMLCVTGDGAMYKALSAWLAAMMQVPTDTAKTVLPLMPSVVQTAGVTLLKVTGRPLLA